MHISHITSAVIIMKHIVHQACLTSEILHFDGVKNENEMSVLSFVMRNQLQKVRNYQNEKKSIFIVKTLLIPLKTVIEVII